MAEGRPAGEPFATVTLAEILLGQDLLTEALKMIETLERQRPDDPRVAALADRARRRFDQGELEQRAVEGGAVDRVVLEIVDGALRVRWELTPAGRELGRRVVRYSGHDVVRLFTALAGPRGVRRHSRDVELEHPAGRLDLFGVPRGAVFVAAVGFRGLNGLFVPLATSRPLVDEGDA